MPQVATTCSAALSMLVLAFFAQAVFAQGFVATDKDGSVIYSNKPIETAPGVQAPVAMPLNADVKSYQLTGTTLEDLQKDAAQKAPVDTATGHRVWSTTAWSAAWNYWTRQEAESCRIDVVSVRLKIATQLPEWREPKEVAAEDHCRWQAFAKTLRQKEAARTAHALARGRDLERAILALPARPRCEGFAAEVAALGQKLVDDGKPRVQTAPPKAPVLMVAKPVAKSTARPAPPPPPKPLPIPQAIFVECRG
jgi:predicted secreted Zn-dependent protease